MTKDEYFQKIWEPGTLKTRHEYFDDGWEAILTEITPYVHALQKALFTTILGERIEAIQKINKLKNKWKEVTNN